MSEWLTTGEMIDRLKVGEVAENNRGHQVYYKRENDLRAKQDDGLMISNPSFLHSKWRILPKYVTFEEAIKALDEGKTVYFQGSYGWNEKVTPKDYESICFEHSPIKDHGLQDIVKGKWTIED